jgi:hypothetical protein
LVDGEAKPDTEKNPEEAASGQGRVPGAKAKTKIEADASSR